MIHPQIAEVPRGLQEPPQGPIDPALLRAADEAQVPPVEERLPLQAVQDSMVGDVPVRIYTPARADEYAVLVYIRGGAFFLGSLETHDHVARSLAKATGCKVIAVDYRRAPEHVFPAGLQDCYSVVRWVVEHGSIDVMRANYDALYGADLLLSPWVRRHAVLLHVYRKPS